MSWRHVRRKSSPCEFKAKLRRGGETPRVKPRQCARIDHRPCSRMCGRALRRKGSNPTPRKWVPRVATLRPTTQTIRPEWFTDLQAALLPWPGLYAVGETRVPGLHGRNPALRLQFSQRVVFVSERRSRGGRRAGGSPPHGQRSHGAQRHAQSAPRSSGRPETGAGGEYAGIERSPKVVKAASNESATPLAPP